MLYKTMPAALAAGALALTGLTPFPSAAQARAQDREWWEKSNCLGLKGVSWIECQKAISQNKRDRKAGRPPSTTQQSWWEKSKCLGLEGVAWSMCQKDISQRKRDREQGVDPGSRPAYWEKSKCLGLEGLAWAECQKALKRKKRARD